MSRFLLKEFRDQLQRERLEQEVRRKRALAKIRAIRQQLKENRENDEKSRIVSYPGTNFTIKQSTSGKAPQET